MAIKTLSIKGIDCKDIVQQTKKLLQGFKPELIIFFASSIYDTTMPAYEFQCGFPECSIIGSTSHSEYCNDYFGSKTVSVMAIDKQSVNDVCVGVVENLNTGFHTEVENVVCKMQNYFGGSDYIFEYFDQYVGIVLFESSAKSEEIFMEQLGAATDILFVGGSSSCVENNVSMVYANAKAYKNAAVLAILKTVNGYDVIKTQSASIFSKKKLLVTKSDLRQRTLYELNNRPCKEVYAEVLGVCVQNIQQYFASNPVGIIVEDEIFVRTFDSIVENGITLHCGLQEGTKIQVLEIGDIIKDTKAALEHVITYVPAGIIHFNCIYRTFEMIQKDVVKQYSELFGQYNSIGFSTFGESFLGYMNETSVILVIK